MIFIYLRRCLILIEIFGIFIWEFVQASVRLLIIIYFQNESVKSGFGEIPLGIKPYWQKVLIAHFVTMTPGSLAIDILPPNVLLVHLIDKDARKPLNDLIQKRIEPLLREFSGEQ